MLIVWGLAARALPGLGTGSYLKRPGGGNLYTFGALGLESLTCALSLHF